MHKGNAKVHVSGHACAGELLYCYNIVRPKNVLPVHGEYRHLVANQQLAIDTGVPEENTIIGEDGTVIDLKDGVATVVGQLDLGYVYVDGSTVGEITEADLKDRRILAEEGFVSIFVAIDIQTGQGHRRPGDPGPRLRRGRGGVRRGQAADRQGAGRTPRTTAPATRTRFSQVVRRIVGRWVNSSHRRRPMIVPVVIEA